MPRYNNRKCKITAAGIQYIDYKNLPLIKKYLTQFHKISPSYYNGNSIKAQKMLSTAIKRARKMALIPYTITNNDLELGQ